MRLYVFLLLIEILVDAAPKIGDLCTLRTTNSYGKCKPLNECKTAVEDLKEQRGFPQTCGFQGTEPKVCCPLQHGEISREKCREYSKYAYETVGEKRRLSCGLVPLIVGGMRVEKKSFPHMASLGTNNGAEVQWLCGGTLISDQFILTAAHCFSHQNITIVRLGVTDLSSNDTKQDLNVSKFVVHPKYTYPSSYHDIALIKLEKSVVLDSYTRPACLYSHPQLAAEEVVATGWGSTTRDGSSLSKFLLQIKLKITNMNACNNLYVRNRLAPMGISDMQFCAQDANKMGGDTCQGDSGGPVQIRHVQDGLRCMHDVVGITSFGMTCGSGAGVYVNVLHYVEWIENEVWLK